VQIRRLDGVAEDPLELFAVFKEFRAVLRLDFEQEALVAGVAGCRLISKDCSPPGSLRW
jgi:hypothetical protein